MRKIIANGPTLKSADTYYVVYELAEDGSTVPLMDELLSEDKVYPAYENNQARIALANTLLTEKGEPELTAEEIQFMLSYNPSEVL